MPAIAKESWQRVKLPALKLSWSSLGLSPSQSGANNIAYSNVKGNRQSVVAQTSKDKVCLLLDGVDLVRTLPFWFSYHGDNDQKSSEPITCVCISEKADTSGIFIAAAADDCIVVWSTASSFASGKEKWQVHSRLNVGKGRISSIDMQRDLLLIGSEQCLTLWMLSSESRQTWIRRWRLRTPRRVTQCLFSPDESSFAVLLENDRRVRLWRLPRGETSTMKPQASCSLVHSRAIKQMSWRMEPEQACATNAITTRTKDGVVRLWTSVIDEPNAMRVWSTIDPSAMTADEGEEARACYYLDALKMFTILRSSLQWLQRDLQMAELGVGLNAADQERILDLKRSRARRLEHLVTETPDMFALLQSDGTLVIRALANVDRRPPTLCQSFVVLKMASTLTADASLITDISAHPLAASASSDCYSPTGLLYLRLNDGNTVKYWITPSLLFDGLDPGLAKTLDTPDDATMASLQTTNDSQINSTGMLAVASVSAEQRWTVSIEDTRSSFFSTAAEATVAVPGPFVDLAWSPSSATCPPMLAVASQQAVYIFCPRRITYVDRLRPASKVPKWNAIAKIDMTSLGRLTITGIVWQSDHTLTVAASNLVLGFNGTLQSQHAVSGSHLIELAIEQAGSLRDSDPEVILQCLIWDKVGIALEIFTNIAHAIDNLVSSEPLQVKSIEWERVEILQARWDSQKGKIAKTTVLDDADDGNKERDDSLARLMQLLDKLRGDTLPCFSSLEQLRLAHLLETTLTLQRHSNLLDTNAIRYLASVRHFATVQEKESLTLDYKSFVWAYRSKTPERLHQILDAFYDGRMNWSIAKRSGVFFWLQSHNDFVNRAEQVARQQFSGQDERDPTACSLLYYAFGKEKLVANLWRQAFWHKDQKKMLTFLKNDFSQARWQAAAFKNAFALLSQRRFEMAASFFLLGGGLRDAVNVCTRNLDDLCLGLTIARLYEGGTKGTIFTDLLRKDVLQQAFKTNNRWLAHWALSMLGEEEQAIEVLCRPMQTLAFASGSPQEPLLAHYEDAEVAMLFSQLLEDRRLPDNLPAGIETRLTLQSHRILCSDGLDGLALATLRTQKLNSTRKSKSKQPAAQSREAAEKSKALEAAAVAAAPKVKVASLIQTAKAESSKQAELSFDVNAFNF